jgi:hypothetical protein
MPSSDRLRPLTQTNVPKYAGFLYDSSKLILVVPVRGPLDDLVHPKPASSLNMRLRKYHNELI